MSFLCFLKKVTLFCPVVLELLDSNNPPFSGPWQAGAIEFCKQLMVYWSYFQIDRREQESPDIISQVQQLKQLMANHARLLASHTFPTGRLDSMYLQLVHCITSNGQHFLQESCNVLSHLMFSICWNFLNCLGNILQNAYLIEIAYKSTHCYFLVCLSNNVHIFSYSEPC